MQLDILRMACDNAPIPAQIGAFRIKTQPLKKSTGEERAYLRSINTCFKCRKQRHLTRDCPIKISHPDSKKPGPPVDVDVSAGRRPLEIASMTIVSPLDAPTIPVTTPDVMTTSKTNGDMDELDNFVDESVNLEESDTLNEELGISREKTPVKPGTSVRPRKPVNPVEESVTTPVMASIPEYITPVDNLDDSLVGPRHPDPIVELGYPGIRDIPENVKSPVVYGKIDGRADVVLGCFQPTLQMLAIFHVFHVNLSLSNWPYGMRISSHSIPRPRSYRWKLVILPSPRHCMCCLYPIAMRFSGCHS